jgi:AraC-like DNA-binding protein
MNARHFSTLDEHPSERPALWSHINQGFFGALDVECLHDGPLNAELDAYSLGPLNMFMIEAPAHRVSRGNMRAAIPLDEVFKLVLQLEGVADIRQRDRVFRLHPGDWSLYDPQVPYSITNHAHSRLLAITIPRQQFKGIKMPELHTCEAHTPGMRGLYAVLGSFLASLAEQLPSLPDGVGQPVSETVLGLLASTLATHRDEGLGATQIPSVFKARVKQYVHAHLADSELSLDLIAQQLRCSKRYLHRVFEDEAQTLDRFIWLMRLERCKEALRAAAGKRSSVSEIAFAWGFNSSAHFCRMFKAQFGVSPRDFQRLELERGEGIDTVLHH